MLSIICGAIRVLNNLLTKNSTAINIEKTFLVIACIIER